MEKERRLNKVLRELNISLDRAISHLKKNGYLVEARPTAKITDIEYQVLLNGFQSDANKKNLAKELYTSTTARKKVENRRRISHADSKLAKINENNPAIKDSSELIVPLNSSVDRSSILKPNQHRYFTIEEHNNRFTLVKDDVTASTYTFSPISLPLQEKIILKINNYNSVDDKALFEYSVLNHYIANNWYAFDVLNQKEKGYEISNNDLYKPFFMPLSFNTIIVNNKIDLKISNIDLEKNKINFFLPILNLTNNNEFLVGENYDFKVIDVFDKESEYAYYRLLYNGSIYSVRLFPNQKELPIPTNILCRVNLIKFDKVYLHQTSSIDLVFNKELDGLEIGETYDFDVVERKDINDEVSLFILKHQEATFKIKIFEYQKDLPTPKIVKCYIHDIKFGNAILHFSKSYLIHQLYSIGNKYTFNVISEEDEGEDYKYLLLNDQYGFTHRLFFNDYIAKDYKNIQKEDSYDLFVKYIKPNGFLVLSLDEINFIINFYSAERVFSELSLDINELFYNCEKEFIQILKGTYESPVVLNKDKQNLWLFSYLSFLDKKIGNQIRLNEYKQSIVLLELYILLEEWMIEGSKFLSNFSALKRDEIIYKAETQISNAKNKLKALAVIISPDKDIYIDTTLTRLNISGRLTDDKLKVLKEVLLCSDELYKRKTPEILQIISKLADSNLIEEFDAVKINRVLEYVNNTEIKNINSRLSLVNSDFDEDSLENIDNVLNVIKLKIKLSIIENNLIRKSYNQSLFYKFLSLKTEDNKIKKTLLVNAVIVIVDPSSGESLYLESLEPISYPLLSSSQKNTQTAKKIYQNNGTISKTEKGWALFTNNLYDSSLGGVHVQYKKLTSFFNESIIIATGKRTDASDLGIDFKHGRKSWDTIYNGLFTKEDKQVKENAFPPNGTEVECIMKQFSRGSKKFSFLAISHTDYSGDGMLHWSNSFGFEQVEMDRLIHPGEKLVLQCEIETQKGIDKVNYKLKNSIWEVTRTLHLINDIVAAQVVSVNRDNTHIIITEKACLAKVEFSETQLLVNHTYEFKIIDRDEQKNNFITELVGATSANINGHDKIRHLLVKEFIIKEDVEDSFENSNSNLVAIKSTTNTIEALINIELDISEKVRLLNLLRLLSSIFKDSKSYYADAKLNYITTIDDFTKLNSTSEFVVKDFVDENTIDVYAELEKCNMDYEKLALFNKKGILNQELVLEPSDKLSSLIMAHNILFEQSKNESLSLHTKKVIDNYLLKDRLNTTIIQKQIILETSSNEFKSNEATKIEITNLGREGKNREFKTSFVFYAGSSSLNIEDQSVVILKTITGFLNASGGSLFIGVNDKGDISGLSYDFKALGDKVDHDFYERRIRKEIVRSLDKDINGQLEFIFKTVNDQEYLEIVIPEYYEAVTLKDKFYQRQGNETRELFGNDIVKFISRKLNLNTNLSKTDHYSSQKIENKSVNSTTINNDKKAIVYFHLKLNGNFFISDKEQNNIDVKYILPIYESQKRGFLLQGYDNGCINKVPVRILLDKKYNYIYSNGKSNEGNLMLLEFVENDDAIIKVNTIKNDKEYVKLYPVNKISEHIFLHLKGNQVVPKEIDYVVSYLLDYAAYKAELSRLIYDSGTPIGKDITNVSYQTEFSILNQI